MTLQRFWRDPFARFLVTVAVTTGLAMVLLGLGIEHVLKRNLIEREAGLTAEAARLLTNVDLRSEQFRAAVSERRDAIFLHVVDHLTSIPEIVRLKIYDGDGTIVWSDEPRAIGLRFHDNDELAEALEGEIEVEMGQTKAEHVYEAMHYDERRLLEIYVPLISPGGVVYGVLEIYKHPVGFFRALDAARRTLWGLCLGMGIVLVALLARIFLRARRTETRLHARARETESQLAHAEKLGVVGAMAAAVAHEINNPLTVLMGTVEALQSVARERALPPPCQEDLGILRRELLRIGEVLRSLLVLARKSAVTLEDVDLAQVVSEVVRFVAPSFARANVTVISENNHRRLPMRGDAHQLKQVLLNLLQNAKDAMPEGGTIRVRTHQEAERIGVEVSDDGHGIGPEIIDRIFEPFFTTKNAGNGSGLGLAVSYGIIKEHRGNMEVESKAGHGSTFRLVFPALA